MGTRMRKSFNIGGGFRINVSKSGVGYSWGVPGYRVTRTSSGRKRTTASIPGTGISYVTESSGRTKKTVNTSQAIQYTDITDLNMGDIEALQPAEFKDLISKIRTILVLNRVLTWLCVISAIFYIGYSSIWRGLFLLIVLFIKLAVRFTSHISLDYKFSDDSQECANIQKRVDSWLILKKSRQIWYVDRIAKTASSRNTGGAASAYERKPAMIDFKLPFYLRSNIQLPVIKMAKGKKTLIILPDCMLLIQKSKVGAVKYEDLHIDIYAIGEICNDAPTSDCKFLKNVWRYANNDGSPDQRHKDNVQLPVYEIGRIDISSPNGLDIRLAISNTDILEEFQSAFTDSVS